MGRWLAGNANAMWGLTFVSILVLSLLPGGVPESDIGSSWIWNFGHVPAYAVLAGVTALVVAKQGPVGTSARLLIFVAIVSFAGGIELVQPLVRRTASIADVGYGAIGAAIGMWMQAFVAKRIDAEAARADVGNGC